MQHPAHQKDQRCGQVEFYLTTKMLPLLDREELGEELHVICLDMQLKDQIARWGTCFSWYHWINLDKIGISGAFFSKCS